MADPIQILSLYSGSGMLDEAVAAGLDYHGYESRVLGFVEREAFAARFLLARMEAETLERAPVWCDGLEALDARPLRGYVDLLTASPPCQPYSSAGKRIGNADARSLGDGDGPLVHTVRIIAECRPALVFFENVPEWFTGGHFREFGEQLCDLGYDFAPPLFVAAADVGAPHERERVFVLGWLADADQARWRWHEPGRGSDRGNAAAATGEEFRVADAQQRAVFNAAAGRAGGASGATFAGTGEVVGDAQQQGACITDSRRNGARERGRSVGPAQRRSELGHGERGGSETHDCQRIAYEPAGGCESMALAGGEGFQGPEFGQAPGDARTAARGSTAEQCGDLGQSELHDESERENDSEQGRAAAGYGCGGVPIFPPGRNDYRRWAALVAGGLDSALMPAAESGVSTLVDGLPVAHADLLRLGGNAVVPQAAAIAFATLFKNLIDSEPGNGAKEHANG